MKKIFCISFLCILLDQLLKHMICSYMNLYQSIEVIKNFFSITYTQNDGAAWSILSGNRFFLILVASVTLYLLYQYLKKETQMNFLKELTYGLLIGGIIGNLIDRILFGYVIDYLDFLIFHYHFPIFNLADICIVMSVILLIYQILKGEEV